MSSTRLLKSGDLAGTLKALTQEIRDNPSEPKHRVFMFQLLCILGQWERALTQLNVLRDMNAEMLDMAQTYQETLNCEALRAAVFEGTRSPLLFGEPEEWMALLLQSVKLHCSGRVDEAAVLRERGFEAAPTSAGTIVTATSEQNPEAQPELAAFEWIADADSRIGPFLEAIVNGKYYWIPFLRIQKVIFEKPSDLRDLVWLPAHFQWTNGGEAVGFVPTRYAGSEASQDDHIRLGRKTEWNEVEENFYAGIGGRVLTTDANEFSLTQIAQIDFNSVEANG